MRGDLHIGIIGNKTFRFILLFISVSFGGYKPAVGRPEARTWSLGAEQLHGWNRVVEEMAEAEHGTD